MMNLEQKEKKEIDFWKDAPEEKPEVFSIPNLINKFGEAAIFLEKLSAYSPYFRKSENILELGGGQGWASCMVKHFHPKSHVVSTDISPYAVASLPQWEGIFRVKLDGHFSARSYQIDLPDESVDLIFCFASAHHFVKHKATFMELKRVLKPDCIILYFHEPVCRSYIHPWSKARANRKRPIVPEDVLIYKRILKLGRATGFQAKMVFSPSIKNRGPFGTIYYKALSVMPFLQHFLPCTGDFIFTKAE